MIKIKPHLNFPTILTIAASLALAFYLGKAVIIFVNHAVSALSFPYPLDYGEGPVLDQLLHLSRGETVYRNTITAPPYTVTSYPPLYLLVQTPLVHSFGLALWYGRAISIFSLILTAFFLGLTLFELSKDALAAITGGLFVFAIPYFVNISVFDRVDTLALALSWAGLYMVVRWSDRRFGIAAAGLLFSAAAFTQQYYLVAAPLTALIWLLLTKRIRRAAGLTLITAIFCAILFIFMNWLTGGGFAFNLFDLATNPWRYPQVAGKLIEIGFNFYFLMLIALAYFIGERLDVPTKTWPFVLPYFLAALLIAGVVGKTGPSDQTVFELAAALCLVGGAAMAWMKNHWARTVLLVMLILQVNGLISWTETSYLPAFNGKIDDRSEIAILDALIRKADKPVLVDEYMGLLPLAGKPVYYEPFEYNQLAQAGLWDTAPLIRDVTQQKFSAMIIYFPRDISILQTRWSDQFLRIASNTYLADPHSIASNLIELPKK